MKRRRTTSPLLFDTPPLTKAQVRGGLPGSSRQPAPGTCPRIPHGPDLDNPRHRRFRRSEGVQRSEGPHATDPPKSIPSPRMRGRASTGKRPGQRPFSTRWQVQDSNLRRHTPTDLQTVDAHPVTCGFAHRQRNFSTYSPRPPLPVDEARYSSFAKHRARTGSPVNQRHSAQKGLRGSKRVGMLAARAKNRSLTAVPVEPILRPPRAAAYRCPKECPVC